MKFSTKDDVALPAETLFTMLSDFEGFERAVLRRDAEIVRTDQLEEIGVGVSWHIKAMLRNKRRDIDVELSQYAPPEQMVYDIVSPNMRGVMLLRLVALSRQRTRLCVEIDVRPKTLSARLLIQSARLARNTLNRRFKTRVSHFIDELEDRHKRQSQGK